MRSEYERVCEGEMNAQGIRRLVRNFLTEHNAVYLDGSSLLGFREDAARPSRCSQRSG